MSADPPLRDAILKAAFTLFTSQGVVATTMDAVAQRAGCSRISVYRHFSDKQGLLRAVVLEGLANEAVRFDAIWGQPAPFEHRIVAAFAWAVGTARTNPILGQLLRSEPDAVLMGLTIEGEGALALATELVAERLRADNLGDEAALTLAEMMCRLVLSILLQPYGRLKLETSEELESFAQTWIVPAFRSARGDPRPTTRG